MSKDEATKEVMSADEYFDKLYTSYPKDKVGNTYRQEFSEFAHDYANYLYQSKLNEVTDEVILRKYPKANGQDALHPDRLRAYGAKWLLKHLKRTES